MSLTVLDPGLQTQLQDEGRWGWQRDGVPVGGALDNWSHRLANLLAGNAGDEATLEILLRGPRLRFERAATIALTGAELSPQLDGHPLPMDRRVHVRAGSVLSFGARQAGLRAYLAVRGGYALAPVLGSRSSYLRGGFGGLEGRALRAGDVLPLAAQRRPAAPPSGDPLPFVAEPPPPFDLLGQLPAPDAEAVASVAVIEGEHWGAFDAATQQAFLDQTWRIGPQSDRMGYRLQGGALARPALGELLSEGVTAGTVQLPPDGQPIVLMAERQTTGGYPRIAHVASVDLPLLAQLQPGQRLRFERVSLDLAQALLEDRERHYARLRRALLPARSPATPTRSAA